MPTLIEERYCPDKELEGVQTNNIIQESIALLTEDQKEIINLAYGLDGDKPMSINKICKKLNISRPYCVKAINTAISLMRNNIKV